MGKMHIRYVSCRFIPLTLDLPTSGSRHTIKDNIYSTHCYSSGKLRDVNKHPINLVMIRDIVVNNG